jgi:hypothetical protein
MEETNDLLLDFLKFIKSGKPTSAGRISMNAAKSKQNFSPASCLWERQKLGLIPGR